MHEHRGDDRSNDQTSGSDSGDAPDFVRARGRRTEGMVDSGWLRPHTRPARGRPRASTVILLLIFISALALYLEVRPG
ncbi:hypothetical protein [Nocardia pseudobrasiliensis]|uniref:Uncharacterized protein n=1 Tax=Nocardia pseudobrasiliensis TaxID=45979 RepID=A0A370IE11_9NOCA|nr:hypothetical protein [Nocardia pseudobrasiliensis]RDI68955.1 hypothetical protein DFR76_101491 [Nocardia pseudobrasiliensis]